MIYNCLEIYINKGGFMSLKKSLLFKELGEQLRILFKNIMKNSENTDYIYSVLKHLKVLNKNLS